MVVQCVGFYMGKFYMGKLVRQWQDVDLAKSPVVFFMTLKNYFLVRISVEWWTDGQKMMQISPPFIGTDVLKKPDFA